MVALATTNNKAQTHKPGKDAAAPAAPMQVFTRQAHELTQPAPFDETTALGVATTGPYSIEVPATGYMRHLLLLVTCSGGSGAAQFSQDGPWNALQQISLRDVNGSAIIEPISGYELMLTNKFGGYSFMGDPALSGAYKANTSNGDFSFILRVPVEISAREARGALANMNAAQPYRLEYNLAPQSAIYSVAPSTVGKIRVRAVLEAWTNPGFEPPGHGIQQFWSKQVYTVNSGMNTIRLSRVGNLYRNAIMVFRDSSGARVDSIMPDPFTLAWDSRQLNITPREVRRHYLTERYGYAVAGFEAGVDPLEFTHDFDGHPGGELYDLWLRTSQATRLEIQGNFGGAGTLTVLTNDVMVPDAAAGV